MISSALIRIDCGILSPRSLVDIDDKLDFRRLLDWQVSRLGTAQEFVDIAGSPVPTVHHVGGIRAQTSILDISFKVIHRGQSTFRSRSCNMRPPREQGARRIDQDAVYV